MTDTYDTLADGDSGSARGPVESTGPDGDGQRDDFPRLKAWITNAHRRRGKFRKEATRSFEYVANQQWSEEDKAQLEAQHRPSVSFNRCAPLIEAVCGLEVNNRQGVVYLPRTMDANGVDEARTGAVKWVRDECNAEDEESESFRDMAICGEGWVETRMSFDDDPQGKIVEERIDPIEMGVDSNASRSNYQDSRYRYRVRVMELEDARALLENGDSLTAAALDATWLDDTNAPVDGGMGNKTEYPAETRAAVGSERYGRNQVRIIQIQWWDRENYHMVAQDGDPDLKFMKPGEYKKYTDRIEQMRQSDMAAQKAHGKAMDVHASLLDAHNMNVATGMAEPQNAPVPPTPPTPTAPEHTMARIKRKMYYQAFLGFGLLEKAPIEMNEFQFQCMTGKRDRKNHMFYGMLRDMFDPQMWANKWLSQTMHIMNTNAKGGIMAETDAFANVRKAEEDWADNTKIIWVKPGALEKNKVKDRTAPPLPQGLGELMTFALSSLRDVTGINLELLGQADRMQAASLETQRRQSAMTILATLFDSLRHFRKLQGRLLLHFVDLLPEGTLVRITEDGLQKYVPLVKDRKAQEYDVIFDEAPTSPDQKQAIWAMTLQLLQGGIPLPPPALVKLLKYSPYPETVVNEISDAMGLGSTLPPEILQQKLAQAEQAIDILKGHLAQATAAANTADAEVAVKAAKASIEQYNAVTKRAVGYATAATTLYSTDAEKSIAALGLTIPSPDGGAGGGAEGGASAPVDTDIDGALAKADSVLARLHGIGGRVGQPQQPAVITPQPNADIFNQQ